MVTTLQCHLFLWTNKGGVQMTQEQIKQELTDLLETLEKSSKEIASKKRTQKNQVQLICNFSKIETIKKILNDFEKITIRYCKEKLNSLDDSISYLVTTINSYIEKEEYNEMFYVSNDFYFVYDCAERSIYSLLLKKLQEEDFEKSLINLVNEKSKKFKDEIYQEWIKGLKGE